MRNARGRYGYIALGASWIPECDEMTPALFPGNPISSPVEMMQDILRSPNNDDTGELRRCVARCQLSATRSAAPNAGDRQYCLMRFES